MRISLLFLTFTIGLLAQYNSAVAQSSRTVKFESRYEKKGERRNLYRCVWWTSCSDYNAESGQAPPRWKW